MCGTPPSQTTIELLLKRRSVSVKNMNGVGPTAEDIETILRAGMRVPDHGKLAPWRFIVIEGKAREDLGNKLAALFLKENPRALPELCSIEKNRFTRSAVCVVVVSATKEHPKIPHWEQILSVGAVCQNMLVAATALGWACQWLTEWFAYSTPFARVLGLHSNEKIAGFLHFGQGSPPPDRLRPPYKERVTLWNA